jgi:hypothetical protein
MESNDDDIDYEIDAYGVEFFEDSFDQDFEGDWDDIPFYDFDEEIAADDDADSYEDA